MPDCVVGVDPGLKGGLACVLLSGEAVATVPMPREPRDLARWVRGCLPIRLVVVERAHAMPGQGVTSMFTFGVGYGTILGVLAALGFPVEIVAPQRWKREVLAGTAKDKAAAIAYAARRFPAVSLVPPGCRRPHDGIADALAIAEFARRLVAGEVARG
jgi:crossover junction endodeoxyribonuclease RuvC